jgi:hypothetical protein
MGKGIKLKVHKNVAKCLNAKLKSKLKSRGFSLRDAN